MTTLGPFEGEIEGISAFAKALSGEDELGVIVRCHTYIEFELDRYIQSILPCPSELKGLQYAVKLKIALACGLRGDLKNPLKHVGYLRNDFAHQIKRKITIDDVTNIRKQLGTFDLEVFESTTEQARSQGMFDPDKLKPRDDLTLYLSIIRGAVVYERLRLTHPGLQAT